MSIITSTSSVCSPPKNVKAAIFGRQTFLSNLANANLRQADLSGARLDAADLRGADLTGAKFAFYRSGNSIYSACSGLNVRASLVGAKLSGAKLEGAELAGSI
jgi:uncharacterized protein YjbI with pentapeptide repeats